MQMMDSLDYDIELHYVRKGEFGNQSVRKIIFAVGLVDILIGGMSGYENCNLR